MAYSYDRRTKTASAASILRIIVDKALEGRGVEALVHAYIDDAVEAWEDENGPVPGFDSTRAYDEWRQETFGIILTALEVEKAFREAYVPLYRRLTGASASSALEVMEVPDGMPSNTVPKTVIEAVAVATARRDAAEANTLRDLARSRQ